MLQLIPPTLLEKRVTRLERENRYWKAFGSLAVLTLCMIGLLGANGPRFPGDVVAHRIVMVDDMNREAVILSPDAFGSFALPFYDPATGKLKIHLGNVKPAVNDGKEEYSLVIFEGDDPGHGTQAYMGVSHHPNQNDFKATFKAKNPQREAFLSTGDNPTEFGVTMDGPASGFSGLLERTSINHEGLKIEGPASGLFAGGRAMTTISLDGLNCSGGSGTEQPDASYTCHYGVPR
jgi:hypothetical protein